MKIHFTIMLLTTAVPLVDKKASVSNIFLNSHDYKIIPRFDIQELSVMHIH